MLSLSGTKALLFQQFLIALITRSAVNVCSISKGFVFVTLVTIRDLFEGVCLPSFEVLNCWLNLLASCLDDEIKFPMRTPNDTAYKRWSCQSGYKKLCKLYRNLPPSAMGARFTVLWLASNADPMDGWRISL